MSFELFQCGGGVVRGVVPVGLAGGTEVAASRPPAGIKTISMTIGPVAVRKTA